VTVSEPPETPSREELLASEREEPPFASDPVAPDRSLTRAVDENENRHNPAFCDSALSSRGSVNPLIWTSIVSFNHFSDNDGYKARDVSLRETRDTIGTSIFKRDV